MNHARPTRLAATAAPASSTSSSTTADPSRCSARAVASPMPLAAPVTTATLPVSGSACGSVEDIVERLRQQRVPVAVRVVREVREQRVGVDAAGAGQLPPLVPVGQRHVALAGHL